MYSSAATMDGKIHQFHHIQFWVNLCCIFSNIFALVNSDLFIHDSTGRLPLLFKKKKNVHESFATNAYIFIMIPPSLNWFSCSLIFTVVSGRLLQRPRRVIFLWFTWRMRRSNRIHQSPTNPMCGDNSDFSREVCNLIRPMRFLQYTP